MGIAKGAGMIEPDMATMLVYLVTDLQVWGVLSCVGVVCRYVTLGGWMWIGRFLESISRVCVCKDLKITSSIATFTSKIVHFLVVRFSPPGLETYLHVASCVAFVHYS